MKPSARRHNRGEVDTRTVENTSGSEGRRGFGFISIWD